jgi:hypothetical protein
LRQAAPEIGLDARVLEDEHGPALTTNQGERSSHPG